MNALIVCLVLVLVSLCYLAGSEKSVFGFHPLVPPGLVLVVLFFLEVLALGRFPSASLFLSLIAPILIWLSSKLEK